MTDEKRTPQVIKVPKLEATAKVPKARPQIIAAPKLEQSAQLREFAASAVAAKAQEPAPALSLDDFDDRPTPAPRKKAKPLRKQQPEEAPAPAKTAAEPVLATGSLVETNHLLTRVVVLLEAQTQLAANPHFRHQAPAGTSPLIDTMRQIAITLAALDEQTPASTLKIYYLSKKQQQFMAPALIEGVKIGAFTRIGGSGPKLRGAKYLLADPTPLGMSWVEVQQKVKERRNRALSA